MSRNTRAQGDWGALVLAELNGHEVPGTVARLTAEATGKVAADVDDVAAPATIKNQLADLKSASEGARAEQAALAKLRSDTESILADAEAAHKATIARELADHKKAMAAAQVELESAKKQSADLLAKAKADSEVAARLKERATKKLAAFEAA